VAGGIVLGTEWSDRVVGALERGRVGRQKATGVCIVALMTRDSSTSETLRVSPAMAITAADVKVKLLILQVWSRGVTA
jgi:hypothetical protein